MVNLFYFHFHVQYHIHLFHPTHWYIVTPSMEAPLSLPFKNVFEMPFFTFSIFTPSTDDTNHVNDFLNKTVVWIFFFQLETRASSMWKVETVSDKSYTVDKFDIVDTVEWKFYIAEWKFYIGDNGDTVERQFYIVDLESLTVWKWQIWQCWQN